MKTVKIIFIALAALSFAQNSFAADAKINAGVLPSIWYSTTTPSIDENIEIYGGIQNHSDLTLSIEAVFYVDGMPNSKMIFISNPKTLIEISSPWTGIYGNHSIQIILDRISSGTSTEMATSSLTAYESDKNTINVSNNVTLGYIENSAVAIAANMISSIDNSANNLADQIETLKKPVSENSGAAYSENSPESSGTSENIQIPGTRKVTPASVLSAVTNSNIFKTAYNYFIDFFSLIIRNWVVSLAILLFLMFIFKFMTG